MARRTGFWDNQYEHIFVELLTTQLKDLDYSFIGYDRETDSATWLKELGDGYGGQMLLLPEGTGKPGYIGFSSALVVVSSRQTEVFNLLRVWECDHEDPTRRRKPERERTPIFVCSLPWLIAHWDPKVGSHVEATFRWKSIYAEMALDAAADIADFMKAQGENFFDYLRTPSQIAHALLQLPDFPGRTMRGGPGSSDAAVFAAVILCDLDRTSEALSALDADEASMSEQVGRGELPQRVLVARRCALDRYRAWIQGVSTSGVS